MLSQTSIENACSLTMPDFPAANHALQLALFLYGTLATNKRNIDEKN